MLRLHKKEMTMDFVRPVSAMSITSHVHHVGDPKSSQPPEPTDPSHDGKKTDALHAARSQQFIHPDAKELQEKILGILQQRNVQYHSA